MIMYLFLVLKVVVLVVPRLFTSGEGRNFVQGGFCPMGGFCPGFGSAALAHSIDCQTSLQRLASAAYTVYVARSSASTYLIAAFAREYGIRCCKNKHNNKLSLYR